MAGVGLYKLVEPLRKWTVHNPETIYVSEKHEKYKRENAYQIKEPKNPKPQTQCLYIFREIRTKSQRM